MDNDTYYKLLNLHHNLSIDRVKLRRSNPKSHLLGTLDRLLCESATAINEEITRRLSEGVEW